jgi:L-ascorbate 6-phosphate lactonase
MKRLTLRQIRAHRVPPAGVTLWWLGQASFILKSPAGKVVALDPYLSNSCKAIGDQHGFRMDRLTPPPIAARELAGVDAYLLTHSHQDHLDPETLAPYRAAGGHGPFIAPVEAADRLRALGVPDAEIRLIWPNRTETVGDLTVRATFAIPFAGDDLTHVGYLVFVKDGPTLYFTGDTGYHDVMPESIAPHRPDVLVTVINGAFRNLAPAEAALLAKKLGVKIVIPCHHDLFADNCLPPELLRTNLKLQGLGDAYRLLELGCASDILRPA